MKIIGLIGGLSPESTCVYYQALNAGVRARRGGHHGARILLSSLDFQVFVDLKARGDWAAQEELLIEEAQRLARAGADFVVLTTNTMHKMADAIAAAIDIPFLHIADATARALQGRGISKVGLLGTRYVMEEDFYKQRLARYDIESVIPDEAGRADVNRIIYDELCKGDLRDDSRAVYQGVIGSMADEGAQGVILGCTEIGLLIGADDADIPVFDTTHIHVAAVLEMALDGAS